MFHRGSVRALTMAISVAALGCGGGTPAEEMPAGATAPATHPAEPDVIEPINDLPNPYTTVDNWVKLPNGREWGSTAGVDIDPDGVHLWAIDRCGGNSCVGSDLPPILKIAPDGTVVAAIGAGLFLFPHGLHVDRDGNVWVTDGQGPNPENPATAGKGHDVIKLSPTGEVLLTLGTPGVAGDGTGPLLNLPCDVVTDADGNIYVGDGHSGQNPDAPPGTVARIAKFDRNGTFIKSWGHLGSGPGELRTPHGLDLDSRNRLVVADRGNNRIQVFDLDGNYIEQFKRFSRPSGLYITDDDTIYVADSESEFDDTRNPGWHSGIRVGSLRDGIPKYYILGNVPAYPERSNPEGVAVDAAGHVYGAVVSGEGAVLKSTKTAM
jgi:DNA-binding beta-propeller fold protein YncE